MSAAPTGTQGWGLTSRVFRLAEMPCRQNPNGSTSHDFARGALATGERVGVHATEQPAGNPGTVAHRNEHTEVICVREGALEVTHDGTVERAEAGDVVLIAKGSLHSLRNVGSGPARYLVVAIGGDA